MQRVPELTRLDIALEQIIVKAIPIVHQRIHPLGALPRSEVIPRKSEARVSPEMCLVETVGMAQPLTPSGKRLHLSQTHRGLQVSKFEVETDRVMCVGTSGAADRAALILQFAKALMQTGIARNNHTALS